MYIKTVKDFFKNIAITIPNILFFLLTSVIAYFTLDPEAIQRLEQAEENVNLSTLAPDAARFISSMFFLLILGLFLTPFISSWSNLMCKDVVNDRGSNIIKNLRLSSKYYWRMFGTTVLKGAIFIGIAILFAFAMTPLAVSSAGGNTGSVTAIAIISIIFFIGFIFFIIALTPVEPLLVYDNLSIGQSFSKGFRFGLRKFFPILGAFIPIGIIVLVTYILLIDYPFVYTFLNSFFSMFVPLYVMNMYRRNKEMEAAASPVYGEPVKQEVLDRADEKEEIVENIDKGINEEGL
jgi:uncharacterized membrane protein YesL